MSGRRDVARLLLWLALATTPLPREAPRAQTLVADLSQHLIAITTAFVGTQVVLFGVAEGGGDIAVTVHGPRDDLVVRRKSRVAGIWVNREGLAFRRVPAYYAVASTRPLEQIARPDVLAQLEIGTDYLELEPIDAAGFEISEITAFKDALVRRKQEQGLFSREPAPINFIGGKLFRTTLAFPANVAPGIYQVQVFEISEITAFKDALVRRKQEQGLFSREPAPINFIGAKLFRTTLVFPANVAPGIYQVQVFELQDGFATDAQRSTLVVSKVGFEADIYDFAQHRAALYGLTAIALAIASGWLAGVVFRRG